MWFYYFGIKTWFCSFGEKYNFAVLRENFNLWVWQKIWFSFWQDKKFEDLTRERDFTILAKQIYVILLFCQRKWFIVFEGRHNIVVWTEIVILQFLLENVRVWHEIMISGCGKKTWFCGFNKKYNSVVLTNMWFCGFDRKKVILRF